MSLFEVGDPLCDLWDLAAGCEVKLGLLGIGDGFWFD
jgi:hypothetical protein